MAKVVRIQANAQLQWRAYQSQAGNWIGVCDPMNLSVEANSLDELHSVINESLNLLLFDLMADNELERFLQEHGWRTAVPIQRIENPQDVRFDVPWELVAEGQRRARDSQQRAH